MRWVRGEAVRARRRERAAIFASAAGQPRDLFDSVRRRLILVVLLAIAPIACVLALQGVLQLLKAEDDARSRLLEKAALAATAQQSVFASAETVLQALSAVDDVRTFAPTCPATLYGANLSLPFAANIALLDADGRIVCSALAPEGLDVSSREWWREMKRRRQFVLTGRMLGLATHAPVIVAALPLFKIDGTFEGALALSINATTLDNQLRRDTAPSTGVMTLFDAEGTELVSNSTERSDVIFRGWSPSAHSGRLGEALDQEGRAWSYATAPLERNGLWIAFARPKEELFRWTLVAVALSFILPALIIVFTLIAIWTAVDRIVLQWLLYIRRVTAVYAQGHYGFRPTRMDRAPSEFRVLGSAIEDMALAVRERDSRLREALAEKTALVREIHHRVKNSLQVVVSLMSLYGSGVSSGEDRRRFEQLRMRVNTLAVVHRLLFEAQEGSQVPLRELLRELARLIESASEYAVKVEVDCTDIFLSTDASVPLALMVIEVVMALPAPRDREARLTLRCLEEGGQVRVAIVTPADIGGRLEDGRVDLAHGFARQLGSDLKVTAEEGGSAVSVAFRSRSSARAA